MAYGYAPTDKKADKPNYSKRKPYSMYFLHMQPKKQIMTVFFYFHTSKSDDPKDWDLLPESKIPAIIKDLTLAARQNPKKSKYYLNTYVGEKNWHQLEFNRISYLAVMLDEVGSIFDEKNPIEFNAKFNAGENNSFLDLKHGNITIDTDDIRTFVYMINHMKEDAQGNTPDSTDRHRFSFDIKYSSFAIKPLYHGTIDPGGDNVGGGESPPG